MRGELSSESSITVAGEHAGERLDRVLTLLLPDLSRMQVQRLIKEGHVRLDNRPVKASYRVEGHEQFDLSFPPVQETELQPEAIPLDVLHEDDNYLVINKPAGMVVHPAAGHDSGTLVNAVLAHAPDLTGVGGERRPGIVHRLDKETSGLILVAKHDLALRQLQQQFKERTVKKEYICLVEGTPYPSEAVIDAPIGRDPRRRKRMAVIQSGSARARAAQTSYQVTQFFEEHALVVCRPLTGRTHQIRVHMAFIGHPLVGDTVYGRRKPTVRIRRHFLHAARITFRQPGDGAERTFEAPLPGDLQHLLDNLS